MAHKHADLMMEYAKDAAETDKPWERWEMRSHITDWVPLNNHPSWGDTVYYRRKPNQEQLDIEAFNEWWLQKGGFSEKRYPSEAWTAALAWERSKK